MLLHPPPIYQTGHILEIIVPLLIVMFIKILITYIAKPTAVHAAAPLPIYQTGHILESIVPLLIVMFIKIFIYYVHIARKKTKN